MPFGLGNSSQGKTSIGFSKKKTYTVRDASPEERRGNKTSGRRRNSVPAGILKRAGYRQATFPGLLEDGMVPQEMAAAIPMPMEAELNHLFTEMVVGSLK